MPGGLSGLYPSLTKQRKEKIMAKEKVKQEKTAKADTYGKTLAEIKAERDVPAKTTDMITA